MQNPKSILTEHWAFIVNCVEDCLLNKADRMRSDAAIAAIANYLSKSFAEKPAPENKPALSEVPKAPIINK